MSFHMSEITTRIRWIVMVTRMVTMETRPITVETQVIVMGAGWCGKGLTAVTLLSSYGWHGNVTWVVSGRRTNQFTSGANWMGRASWVGGGALLENILISVVESKVITEF